MGSRRKEELKTDIAYFKCACSGCHSNNGKRMTGPNLNRRWGITEKLEGGGTVKIDEDYVRESVLEPQKKIVAGFAPPNQQMTPFKGELKDDQIGWIIEYLRSIKDTGDEAGASSHRADSIGWELPPDH